jgi:ATP-dependent exoDNAse (exonuclease V) alpha subunit
MNTHASAPVAETIPHARSRVWSTEQAAALDKVGKWLKSDSQQVFRLFGYAGTGKTTLAKHLAASMDGDTAFAAFSGKAASVMRANGCDGASTIHSLIYSAALNDAGEPIFTLDPFDGAADADLIVIDECSMIDADMARDLLSFGKPILVLGDPAQLPPVRGAGYFTGAAPDALLTKIHRQAADNPIIRMATTIREGGTLEVGQYGESSVIRRGDVSMSDLMAADQVLVGRNATRPKTNAQMRQMKGRTAPIPVNGDRLLCLRSNTAKGVLNGTLGNAAEVSHEGDYIKLVFKSDDGRACKARVLYRFFDGTDTILDAKAKWKLRDQFGFGYALTVHKAQGSQWADVLVYDESEIAREDKARWLYTAVTRAATKLTLVLGERRQ